METIRNGGAGVDFIRGAKFFPSGKNTKNFSILIEKVTSCKIK